MLHLSGLHPILQKKGISGSSGQCRFLIRPRMIPTGQEYGNPNLHMQEANHQWP
jgi:hypothetical protein